MDEVTQRLIAACEAVLAWGRTAKIEKRIAPWVEVEEAVRMAKESQQEPTS